MYSLLHFWTCPRKMTIDGAARWHATTLRLQKKGVDVKFAMFSRMGNLCVLRAILFLRTFINYKALKGMETRWCMFSHLGRVGQRIFLPGS